MWAFDCLFVFFYTISLSLSVPLSCFLHFFYAFNRFLCSSLRYRHPSAVTGTVKQAIEMQLNSTTGSFNCSNMPRATYNMPHVPPSVPSLRGTPRFFGYFLRFWLALIELHEHIHQKCMRIYIPCIYIYIKLHNCSICGIFIVFFAYHKEYFGRFARSSVLCGYSRMNHRWE